MIEETLLDAMEKMGKAVEHVQAQFIGVRTGRANASLVEKLQVEYYGAFVPLQQLASFQVPEARMLVVKPHDRGSIAAIERALQSSDLGLSPSNDGVVIRLSFPALTEERRKEFVKVVKNMAEEGRVTVRNIRRDARKVLETAQKDGDISQDDLDRAEKELEQLTHTTIEAVDKAFARKEQELLEV
ncbi:MAG: ribosome recycling factor [Actinobacteria bacterium]|nr:ribosome recycling factor [Actinomycetota bacterium]NCW83572.1 ribosome recycling factor [Acidimicrobiia bacterium]NBO98025.1 ribosome recycling factor [Actinomycetota bacterium]NBQ04371.1 ribosome recycling factor [Actinomycetota bacterium]NBY61663.1 ribosome recycling factor [Actinomycetota bacterium]